MNETEPKYFAGFKDEMKLFATEMRHFRGDFHVFRKDIYRMLDSHQNQIAEVSVKVTDLMDNHKNMSKDINMMKGHMAIVLDTLENHTNKLNKIELALKNKADYSYVKKIDIRTRKLEKQVFS